MKRSWSRFIYDDLNYKIVATFVALILWLTILGRRDFVLVKEVNVDFVLPATYQMVSAPVKKVELKVSGPRAALQKFERRMSDYSIVFDLGKYLPGRVDFRISKERFEVPSGVKILSIEPDEITVETKRTGGTE